jgi:T5orf172 domain
MKTDDGPLVYFIQSDDDGPIKIGYVSRASAFEARLRDLQVGSPFPLSVMRTVPGNRRTEAAMHIRFGASRVSGEWFLPSDDLLKFLRPSVETRGESKALNKLIEQAHARGYKAGYEAGERNAWIGCGDELRAMFSKLPFEPKDWEKEVDTEADAA